MSYCHQHNLVRPELAEREKNFGVRVKLPPGDTFARLLGNDWEKTHWFASEAERDAGYQKLATRHPYYRKTDTPTQMLEKVVR